MEEMLRLEASEKKPETRNQRYLSDMAGFQWGRARIIRFISSGKGAIRSSPIDPAPPVECQTVPTTEIPAAAPNADTKPWNLRKRRAICKPIECAANAKETEVAKKVSKKNMTFSISLSKKEIEEDFMCMIGEKPSRKCKKRLRSVQNQMDMLFPGLKFDGIKLATYKI